MNSKVVMGLGFGDEGKGMFTDYLCSRVPVSYVIRFNGGHQAGHTVERDGIRHVCSNVGSGTLAGVSTYWSKYCTVDPVGLVRELEVLEQHNIHPTLYIDAECPITTEFDKRSNQNRIDHLENGTCGVGFGTTVEREQKFYHLQFQDLFYSSVAREKLRRIADDYYCYVTTSELELSAIMASFEKLLSYENVIIAYGFPPHADVIYEGAQGLLLDQHYGFYPNVTWSNCGTANIPRAYISEFYLITRAYQTRHGAGYMSNKLDEYIVTDDPLENNQVHPFQGHFRCGLLDLDLILYAIDKDPILRLYSTTKHLVITCLDHMKQWALYEQGKVKTFGTCAQFVSYIYDSIQNKFKIDNLYISSRENGAIVVKTLIDTKGE